MDFRIFRRILMKFMGLAVFMLLSAVMAFAAEPSALLKSRIQMIHFASEHIRAALQIFYVHEVNKSLQASIKTPGGLADDPVQSSLRRHYYVENQLGVALRPHMIRARFRFIDDAEFKVFNVEPDRLAINENGSILWNQQKLESLQNFSVMDAFRILLHELNHDVREISLVPSGKPPLTFLPQGQKPSELSELGQKIKSDFISAPVSRSQLTLLSVEQKDQFVSEFIQFLESASQIFVDPLSQRKITFFNLLMLPEPKILFDAFGVGRWHSLLSEGVFSVIEGKNKFTDISAQIQRLLEDQFPYFKGREKISGNASFYLFAMNANVWPFFEITKASFSSSDEIVIQIKNRKLVTFANDKGLLQYEHLEGLSMKDIPSFSAQMTLTLNTRNANDSFQYNFKNFLPEADFQVSSVEQAQDHQLVKIQISGYDGKLEASEIPVLLAKNKYSERFYYRAESTISLEGGIHVLSFRVPRGQKLILTEVVIPEINSTYENSYLEYSIQSQRAVELTGSDLSPQEAKPLNANVHEIKFDSLGYLHIEVHGDSASLSQIRFLVIEQDQYHQFKNPNIGIDQRSPLEHIKAHPTWPLSTAERIYVEMKPEYFSGYLQDGKADLKIPIFDFSKLKIESKSNTAYVSEDTKYRSVTGLWLGLSGGQIKRLELPQWAVFDPELLIHEQLRVATPITSHGGKAGFKCERLFNLLK